MEEGEEEKRHTHTQFLILSPHFSFEAIGIHHTAQRTTQTVKFIRLSPITFFFSDAPKITKENATTVTLTQTSKMHI